MSYKGGHNEKYPNENFHSFQFFKYHSFYGHTTTNFPILFYGNKPKTKDFYRISKYIKQNGYVTGYASDFCFKDFTYTIHNLTKEEVYIVLIQLLRDVYTEILMNIIYKFI